MPGFYYTFSKFFLLPGSSHFWIRSYTHFVILFLQVALVGQEPVLFARTVEENITYGLTDVPMETVVQAAAKANAHDFITNLPNGYNTSNY